MPLAVRQHADLPDADEWVTIDQAAEISGESVRTWRWRAQQEAHEAKRAGRQSLAVKARTPAGRGRRGWHVHRSMHDALTRFPRPFAREEQAHKPLLQRHPQHQAEHAYRKAHWLRKWRKTIEHGRLTEREAAVRIIEGARQVDGETFKISLRSLQAWYRAYNRIGKDGQILGIEGLIDRRSSPTRSSGDTPRRGRSSESTDYFYSLFHTENKLSTKLCHEHTARKARSQGWPGQRATAQRGSG